ncbi:MAG: hypothetical protein LBE49_07030, partial [Deltaproteobacteria bacterium]|nr:hypothetical protein [Deltaproteobacteria bacterium]
LDSEDFEARKSLVAALLAEGLGREPEKARGHLERLLSSNQNDSSLWNALAELETELERPSAALAALERSLLLNPAQPDIAQAAATLRAKVSPSTTGLYAQAGASSGSAAKPSAPSPPVKLKRGFELFWLAPPEREAESAALLEHLSKSLFLTKVVSLKFEPYLEAASKGDSVLWLEGAGQTTRRLLAAFPNPGRRVILSLSTPEVVSEAYMGLNFSHVFDIVVEAPFLRELLVRRLKETGTDVRQGCRFHVAARAVDFDKLPVAKVAAKAAKDPSAPPKPFKHIVAPGPHGPFSGLRETMEAFAILHALDPELRLYVGGPFEGGVWELMLAYMVNNLNLGDSVMVAPKPPPLGAFLADKEVFMASPVAALPSGLLEALDMGLVPLVKGAAGLEHLRGLMGFWKNSEELMALASARKLLTPEGRKELRAAHEPQAAVRRRLEILASQ